MSGSSFQGARAGASARTSANRREIGADTRAVNSTARVAASIARVARACCHHRPVLSPRLLQLNRAPPAPRFRGIIMPEDVIQTDMVIIGAGPCGLFAVFEAGLLGMKCQLVDNLDKIGGQCAELYPDKPIYDIPAVPRCTGQELVDQPDGADPPFEPQFHLKQQASALTRLPDGRWRLETDARHGARGAGGRDRRRRRQLRAAPPAAAGCRAVRGHLAVLCRAQDGAVPRPPRPGRRRRRFGAWTGC